MLEKIFKSRKKKALLLNFLDFCLFKRKNKLLIVVKHSVDFSGNLRIITDELVKSKFNFKIYIYKDGNIPIETKKYLSKKGIVILEGFSLYILFHIITSGVVIVGHTIRDAYISKYCKNRFVINLWHGVIFKNIELLMKNLTLDKKELIENNSKIYNLLISSSKMDQLKMSKAFNLNIKDIYVTGLPRYEILKNNYSSGDKSLQNELSYIKKLKSDKKLVLYAPTFRETDYNPLDTLNLEKIAKIADKNNFIFCIRMHPYTKIQSKYKESKNIVFISNSQCRETNLLLKYTDLLIVDYSSIWIDFLLLNKPIIMYVPDINNYLLNERGFAYNFSDVISFNIYSDFNNVLNEVVYLLKKKKVQYKLTKSLFHKYDLSSDYRDNFIKIFNFKYKEFINE